MPHLVLDDETRQILQSLTNRVHRFTIMYAVLWTTLVLAFFFLLLRLHGGP